MANDELIKAQKEERGIKLQAILDSKHPKKMIDAGAGTGKTFTFSQILRQNPEGKNIAMTFIRLLRDDMFNSIGDMAEVKTFHEFCKGMLHKKLGGIDLYPKLPQIIEADSIYLDSSYSDIIGKFQRLEEGPEIDFFLGRSDYYQTISFDDSVYRMLKLLENDPDLVPSFDQILVDEFQDFNPLEVAFIDKLHEFGNILIVGDDDQAVYPIRNASASYLRDKYNSGEYEVHELPFCSRCTTVIVDAVNGITQKAQESGYLQNRIPKRYECFVEKKQADSETYSKIHVANGSTVQTAIKLIKKAISDLNEDEINESWKEGEEYPTVLIVGAKKYLNAVNAELEGNYANYKVKKSQGANITIEEAYNILLKNNNSNLGWRILIDFYLEAQQIKEVVTNSQDGTQIKSLIPEEFVNSQREIIELLKKLSSENEDIEKVKNDLNQLLPNEYFDEVVSYFSSADEEEIEPDKTKPSILLSSFPGCKGLSAGLVIIVGANNGVIPQNPNHVSDAEISQFIVALTRTRKECLIISETWYLSPKNPKTGKWNPRQDQSLFIEWIPKECINNLGDLKSADIQ